MKKLLIGLLIVAAGAGAFFYLREKNKTTTADSLPKEWIIGKWKIESLKASNDSKTALVYGLASIDSNFFRYDYEFTKDNLLLRSLGDTLLTDTTGYAWKGNDIVLQENLSDTSGKLMKVLLLAKDSLQVLDDDSTMILFTKRK